MRQVWQMEEESENRNHSRLEVREIAGEALAQCYSVSTNKGKDVKTDYNTFSSLYKFALHRYGTEVQADRLAQDIFDLCTTSRLLDANTTSALVTSSIIAPMIRAIIDALYEIGCNCQNKVLFESLVEIDTLNQNLTTYYHWDPITHQFRSSLDINGFAKEMHRTCLQQFGDDLCENLYGSVYYDKDMEEKHTRKAKRSKRRKKKFHRRRKAFAAKSSEDETMPIARENAEQSTSHNTIHRANSPTNEHMLILDDRNSQWQ
jgi:hypothetical protein